MTSRDVDRPEYFPTYLSKAPRLTNPACLSCSTALVCVVPKDKFTSEGPLKKWKGTADSGNAVWRWFCSECGSPIAHDPEGAPEIIALKGGSLDKEIKQKLKPVCLSFFFFLFPS